MPLVRGSGRRPRIAYDSVARLASRPILSGSNMDLVWERMAHLKRALELFEGKSIMTEHTLRCLDLKLTARHDFTGWSWIVDGPESRNAAIARDEYSAKNACINVAKVKLRQQGISIPDCLGHPRWQI